MLSKKFCCKPTLFFATLRRFCPVWLSATVAMLVVPCYIWRLILDRAGDVHGSMQVIASIGGADAQLGLQINEFLLNIAEIAPIATLLYAVVPAAVLLSYLYQSRSALGLHALPITRNTLFITYYLAGLAMLLLPLLIISAITLPILLSVGAFWPQVWGTFLACYLGCYLFFFSFAIFCGLFTGQLWGMPLFYAIFNAVAFITFWVFAILAEKFLYGFSLSGAGTEFIEWLAPVWKLDDALWAGGVASSGSFSFMGLGVVAFYALVGIVFAVVALLLMNARHLERAGEIVTVNVMRPVFHICMSLYGGFLIMMLCCELFDTETLGGILLFLALGVLVGFAAGKMLLEKTIAILSLRALAQYGVTLCVACLIFLGFYSDLLGYQAYLPEVEDVASVEISVNVYADQVDFVDGLITATTDTQISQIIAVHALLLEEYQAEKSGHSVIDTGTESAVVIIESVATTQEAEGEVVTSNTMSDYTYGTRYTYLTLTYALENGRCVTREYFIYISQEEITRQGSAVGALEAYVSSFDPVRILTANQDLLSVSINDNDYARYLNGEAGSATSASIIEALIADLEAQGSQLSLLRKYYNADRTAYLYVNEVVKEKGKVINYDSYAWAAVYPDTNLNAYFQENANVE